MPARYSSRTWPRGLVLAIPPLLAGLLYWPTLAGDFLCDDLMLVKRLLLPGGAEGGVDWEAIGSHFSGPWFGITRVEYYRPLLSLSLGIDAWLGGGSPLPFHVTNLLLHCLASFLCAWLCAECYPERPRPAALIGGLLLAVHPIATESVATISCRNSTLEIACRLASMLVFARYLQGPGPRRLGWVAFWAVLALLAKESALLLPIAFVALDLILSPARPWRQRLRPHLLLCSLWAGYMLLRLAVFGTMRSPVASATLERLQAYGPGSLVQKLGQVFLPRILDGQVELMTVAMPMLVLLALVLALRSRHGLGLVGLGVVWILVQYLPTHVLGVGPGLINSRYSYGVVTSLALLMSLLLAAPQLPPRVHGRWIGAMVLITLACLAHGSWQWSSMFSRTWRQGLELQDNIDALGQSASEQRPLAFLTARPPGVFPPIFVWQELHTFTERPHARANYPMVNLGSVFDPGHPHQTISTLFKDASPLRALWQQGSELLLAQPGQGYSGPKKGKTSPALELRRHERQGNVQRFTFRTPISSFWVEALRVDLHVPHLVGRLRWLDANQKAAGEMAVRLRLSDDVESVGELDLVDRLDFLALSLAGEHSLAGFEFEFSSPDQGIVAAEVLPRVGHLEGWRRFAGEELVLDRFETVMRAPPGAQPMRIVILGPELSLAQDVTPGQPVLMQAEMRTILAEALPFYRQKLYYYYFEEMADMTWGRASRRSALDWFRLRIGD